MARRSLENGKVKKLSNDNLFEKVEIRHDGIPEIDEDNLVIKVKKQTTIDELKYRYLSTYCEKSILFLL